MRQSSVILLLFLLTTVTTVAQETYLNTTLRKQPWSDLPVIHVNEARGGLQTLEMDVNSLTATELNDTLNTLILPNFRSEGMVVVTTDATGNSRYFQLLSPDSWREVFIITSWQPGVEYIPGQPILHNGNLFIAKNNISGVEPLVDANWKTSWANLGGLDSTDLDFALKNLGNLEDVAINRDLTPNKTDTLNLGSALLRWSKLYLADSLFIGADTIADIATLPDWTESDTLNNTSIASVAYTHKAIKEGGNEMGFVYGTKPITRTGLPGVTGQSMDVANLEDFLKKVFFPVTSPLINSFNYNGVETTGNYSFQVEDAQGLLIDNVGTINVPFSIWNAGNFVFNYDVENRSVRPTDSSEETPIDSVVLYNGTTRILNNGHGVLDPNISGTFTLDNSYFTVDVDNAQTNPLTLMVYDAYPNAVPLTLNVDFQPALGVLVPTAEVTANGASARFTTPEGNGASATPYLIERTGLDIDLDLYWTFNERDDAGQITDIGFLTNGGPFTPAEITGTALTTQREDLVIANDHLGAFRYAVRARGAVANDWSGYNYTRYYQLADRGYVGYINNNQRLNITDQGSVISGFTNALCLLNYTFNAKNPSDKTDGTDGITLANNIGEAGFLCFAIPVSKEGNGNTYTIETYNVGKWDSVETTGVELMNITTNGATEPYYVVFINTGSAVTNNGESVTARIIKN